MKLKFVILVSIFFNISNAREAWSQNSCHRYWSYQREIFEVFGFVEIPQPNPISNKLTVQLSLAAKLPTNYYGSIDLTYDKDSTANNVQRGLPISYHVRFPIQNPLPKMISITFNGQLLCTEPKEVAAFVTTITLSYTFSTGTQLQTRFADDSPPIFQLFPPTQPLPSLQTFPPLQLLPSQPNLWSSCGKPEFKAIDSVGLVVNGQTTVRGQFPWMAAYYHNGGRENGFICGGSLVSSRIVLTAAHCIQNKNDPSTRKAEDTSFFIGKYNIESFDDEQNFIVSGVTQLVIHPQWNYRDEHFDADIAVAILVKTLLFTKFVKPICLWTISTSFEDLVGKTAVISGWGKTEYNTVSTKMPKWANVKVVDQFTCLQSNTAFNNLVSQRTFCAGDLQAKVGPCSGDSGGGLVVEQNDRWYLRGIISSSFIDRVLSTCDTKSYAVYTDVSQYTSWIQEFIQNNG